MGTLILRGDARALPLKDNSVQCCVTSPPYWGLRDYGVAGQLGLERAPEEYVENMVAVFREVKRVLRNDGTLWLNLGDSYTSGGRDSHGNRCGYKQQTNRGTMEATGQRLPMPSGLKPKDLCMIPARVAMALQADGWYLRSDIIWSKPNTMPESVTDRPTKAHEYIFLLSKSERYFWDQEAVREESICDTQEKLDARASKNNRYKETQGDAKGFRGLFGGKNGVQVNPAGRNLRSVWTIATAPYPGSHFAIFPTALAERCIKAGTSEKGCCSICGAPWAREIESSGGRDWRNDQMKTKGIPGELSGEGSNKRGQSSTPLNDTKFRMTVGWRPSCTCNVPVAPCIVLDPFAGAGTTLLVADRLGRHGIGLDLKPDYCTLAYRRIAQDAPLFNS